MTDPNWQCTDCKYEGAPRETCTCPRCNGKMNTAEERAAVVRKAATVDAFYRCSVPGCGESGVCDECQLRGSTASTAKPNKPDKRERFAELLGTDSKNFLGTGLTMNEFMQLHRAEQLTASWALQPPEEKKRRRRAVIALSQELGHIEQTIQFSTRLAELAIESVIEGDWKMVQEWADHFTFDKEDEGARAIYAPVFATFRELLLQTLRSELPA